MAPVQPDLQPFALPNLREVRKNLSDRAAFRPGLVQQGDRLQDTDTKPPLLLWGGHNDRTYVVPSVLFPCHFFSFFIFRYKLCWCFQGVSVQVWQRRCHMFFILITPLWCLLSPKSLLRFIPVIVAVVFPSTCALYLERVITTLHIQQML